MKSLFILFALLTFGFANAQSNLKLTGTTWKMEIGSYYTKVEFTSNSLIRIFKDEKGKEGRELIKDSQCKVFSYADRSVEDVLKRYPSAWRKEMKKGLIKMKMFVDLKYSTLVTSEECTGGDVYIALDEKNGILILDQPEGGFSLVDITK